jgi:uncharacterized protein YdhG (YjbR/CyaY superfamily)
LKAKAVDEYIAGQPEHLKHLLNRLRSLILKTIPEAQECMSYGMPAYKINKPVVYFAAFKNHIGFYPTAEPIHHFSEELKELKFSKGAVQLPLTGKWPEELMVKMILFRVQLINEKAG